METEQKKKRIGCWVLVALVAAILLFSLIVIVSLGMAVSHWGGTPSQTANGRGVDEYPQFQEIWSYGQGKVKAVRIALDGVIMRYVEGRMFEPAYDMVEQTLRQIRAARQDENVRVLLLEVNSPGGVLTPSDEIYRALQTFRASRDDRRIVVFVRDLAASGGYLASVAGDWIIAEPTAIVGSIGVIIQTLNWHALSEEIGITDTTIVSGANKDLLNPFQPVSEEHVEMFQDIVDANHRYFVEAVARGRGMNEQRVKALADGRLFTAARALDAGLIDEVGYFDRSLEKVRELADVDQIKVVRYHVPTGFLRWLSQAEGRASAAGRLPDVDPRLISLYKQWNTGPLK